MYAVSENAWDMPGQCRTSASECQAVQEGEMKTAGPRWGALIEQSPSVEGSVQRIQQRIFRTEDPASG